MEGTKGIAEVARKEAEELADALGAKMTEAAGALLPGRLGFELLVGSGRSSAPAGARQPVRTRAPEPAVQCARAAALLPAPERRMLALAFFALLWLALAAGAVAG